MARSYNNSYSPKGVMSIHGINSDGSWQDILSALGKSKLPHFPYRYGKIYNPWNTDILARKFRDWFFKTVEDPYNDFDIEKPFYRPSIVAHSLGTLIIVKALTAFPEIKFDKIFLHGAIVPSNFDWYQLITRDQLRSVINEKSRNDRIVPLSLFVTGSFSPCCTSGFVQQSTF